MHCLQDQSQLITCSVWLLRHAFMLTLYTGVPAATSAKLPANEWVNSALTLLGGKGGGKPTLAQGQGADFGKAADALAAAEQFAAMKL
jgi:alanyl-tRNA synthetase